MKKTAMALTAFLMILAAVFAVMGVYRIRGAYAVEIRTVQNLAGRVITAYPETEDIFLEALNDAGKKDADTGREILAHYGYDEKEKIRENVAYLREVKRFFMLSAAGCIVSVSGVCFFLYRDRVRKKKTEEKILSVLESALAGDFGFTENSQDAEIFDDPLFADSLIKLGNALKVKTQRLDEEHDNTKTLVTDISHQLKTPVSALRACFSMYEEAEDETERLAFYERCRLQIDKLEMLAAALVNVSYLETHLIRLRPQEVLLTDILTESVNSVYHKAGKKQIKMETIFETEENPFHEDGSDRDSESADRPEAIEDTVLQVDKKWTVEAVANVLDNAVKYSPAGATIFIRVREMVNYLRIEVEDRGPGIKPEERNRVFRRFYRGEDPIVRKEEGTGIGLYLSDKILTDEGGSIFVRPAAKKGSIFIIQLPLLRK